MAALGYLSAMVLGFCLWFSLISPAHSQRCTSQKFTNNNLYAHCLDLPALNSFLHFTYDSMNSTLSIAFIASPSKAEGWISWALNPTVEKMAGSQALVAYKNPTGEVIVKTYNISGYTPDKVVQSKLDFDVWDTVGEEDSGKMRIFAKIKVPSNLAAKGTINHVWQVGPSVKANGGLTPHEVSGPNLMSVGNLDFKSGQSGGAAGGHDSRTQKKNIHGILNAVSWGFLFPLGIIIARYLRTFQSADPAWFYLHVSCQVSAYVIGVAGWGTGMKLGSGSSMQFSGHRNIGITLFAIATLQILALFLRPNKDHKYRFYWNIYHHSIGYTILVLGIINVFKGLDMLQPAQKWRLTYVVLLVALGAIAAFLEIITWIVVLRRRSSKSSKPYDGYDGHRRQPFSA
uniref:Cytochrome b561 and DOMON domain-containing protein n=1 Tax=Rhizophora mucronata TaxID=61149 RepID=A0A2P2IPQ5_RHIMU